MECKCIKCGKVMENIADKGLQPLGGLAFLTYGHYGSAYFDPLGTQYLEITVCDPCVEAAERDGLVFRADRNNGEWS